MQQVVPQPSWRVCASWQATGCSYNCNATQVFRVALIDDVGIVSVGVTSLGL